jgi:ATP-dependent Lon protease
LSIEEKITIVNKFILPEINKKMGFENIVDIDNKTIEYIIKSYTLEPGVRKLKEILFDLYGEINLQLLEADTVKETPVQVTMFNIDNEYLAKYSKINEKKIHGQPEVGIINGLWANSLGNGGITAIQTMFYPCSVFLELQLTGLQGDVMKESMNVAKSLAWNLTTDEIKEDWLTYFEKTKCQGLHIHCPEGAISKDGPSAGAAITTAIYSLLNSKKIKNDIAITGEITLNGSVTAIGGLDIKLSYGIKNGVKTFLFPKDNHREFKLWFDKNPPSDDLEFIEIENIKEIFKYVFL